MTSPVAKAARSVPSLQEVHADPGGLRWHLLVAKPADNVPTLLEFHADTGGLRLYTPCTGIANNKKDRAITKLRDHYVHASKTLQAYYNHDTGPLCPC